MHARPASGTGLQLLQADELYLPANMQLPCSLRCLHICYRQKVCDGRLPAALHGCQLAELYLTRIADTRFLRSQLARLLTATLALRVLAFDSHRYQPLRAQVRGPALCTYRIFSHAHA